jgi:hypothetical protein
MADVRLVSEPDHELLRKVIQKEIRRELAGESEKLDDPDKTQDIYIAKVPDDQDFIPARSGTTCGSLDCDIYKIDVADGSLDIITDVERKIYNIYLCKLYRLAQPYFNVVRTKHGLWICEKPRMFHKAKPTADILINASGPANLMFAALETELEETVWLNWMHGGQQVSIGIEIEIEFFEDENKWIITNAGCEVE